MKFKSVTNLARACMVLAVAFGASVSDAQAENTVVTDENYSLAETDGIIEGYVKKISKATNTDGVGVLMHYRKGADPKDKTIMRINFDTIYSWAIVDLTEPATLTMPETNGRYQSAWIVSEDGYYPGAFDAAGDHQITQEWIGGARYAVIVMRTQVNLKDPDDLTKANALQDKLKLTQKDKGSWEPVKSHSLSSASMAALTSSGTSPGKCRMWNWLNKTQIMAIRGGCKLRPLYLRQQNLKKGDWLVCQSRWIFWKPSWLFINIWGSAASIIEIHLQVDAVIRRTGSSDFFCKTGNNLRMLCVGYGPI